MPARWSARPALVAGAAACVAGRWVPGTAGLALMIAGYAALAAFALANRQRRGLVLIAAGLLANLAVIAIDGGMPVAGLPAAVRGATHHHGLSRADHLSGLADVIGTGPLGRDASPGDVTMALGGVVAVASRGRPRTGQPGNGSLQRPAGGTRR